MADLRGSYSSWWFDIQFDKFELAEMLYAPEYNMIRAVSSSVFEISSAGEARRNLRHCKSCNEKLSSDLQVEWTIHIIMSNHE